MHTCQSSCRSSQRPAADRRGGNVLSPEAPPPSTLSSPSAPQSATDVRTGAGQPRKGCPSPAGCDWHSHGSAAPAVSKCSLLRLGSRASAETQRSGSAFPSRHALTAGSPAAIGQHQPRNFPVAVATLERKGNHENAMNWRQITNRRRCGSRRTCRRRNSGHGGPRLGGWRDAGPAHGGRVDLHPAAPVPGAVALLATWRRPAAAARDARLCRQAAVV